MKPRIIKPATHAEWLEERSKGIGASDVAAILGLSPFETPFSLWLKKTGRVEPEPENDAMKLGHLLEPVVAQLWEEATGEKVIKASAADIIYVHPEYDYLRATPDRIVRGRKKIVECKTTLVDIDPDDPPTHWVVQVVYQMYVTGIHQADLAWLVKGRFFGYAHIDYDEDFAKYVAGRVSEFWNENIVGGKEPDCIAVSDFAFKGSDPGTVIEADEEALSHVLALRTLNREIAEKEADAEAHKEAIELYMGENESLSSEGEVLATWKTGVKSRTFRLRTKIIDELLNRQETNGND